LILIPRPASVMRCEYVSLFSTSAHSFIQPPICFPGRTTSPPCSTTSAPTSPSTATSSTSAYGTPPVRIFRPAFYFSPYGFAVAAASTIYLKPGVSCLK
jgi:hypothetical protein